MTPSLHAIILLSAHLPQFIPAALVLIVTVAFISVLVTNRLIIRRVRQETANARNVNEMMQRALKISGNNVVRFDLRDQHIYKLYGHLLPDEGVSLDVWKEHVHPDDLQETLRNFQLIMLGQLERSDIYYRWNMDYSGGRPRWAYLHNVSVPEYVKGIARPVSIISTLVDETDLRRQQQEESELTDKYRLIFEQSIVGLSFYDAEGNLLDANANMRKICHFDNEEGDAFFSSVNLFDISPFREVVDRDHVEELWLCTQSVIPERDMHEYLEIRLHPIRDDVGQLVYLAITARDVSEERQMYLQAKLNDQHIRKANEEIQRYEEELRYLMANCEMRAWRTSFERREIEFYQGLSTVERTMSFDEFQTYFLDDTGVIAENFAHPELHFTQPVSYTCRMLPMFGETDEFFWMQLNNVPEYDENGHLRGCFGLIRNVSGLMRKQELLKRETERANDSGRLKSVFLANMTHEIRTPLNAIVGFSDLLQSIESPDDKREMIRVIHNNCDMLLRLINDILVLSNVDANVMQIVPEEVDFAREFDEICQSLSQRVSEPGVQFVKDNPLGTLPLRIDNGRIQQVITNFVTNAVKYTQQGHIRVGYRLEERDQRQGLYVYCEDTGTGIPNDQLDRVFERFVKLNDFIQGTGLGLSICKAIIEKCNGQIGVESEEGKGSTFWFWIPV